MLIPAGVRAPSPSPGPLTPLGSSVHSQAPRVLVLLAEAEVKKPKSSGVETLGRAAQGTGTFL